MKTFEERYTAWIDGQLTGDTLTAFELELARRADAGDAAAELDKADALHLRALLKEHLQAPALTNTEFFNHQMRERIDTEIDKAARRRESTAKPAWQFPAFAWPFVRLAGAGAACLFVAGALYYGMVPQHPDDNKVTKATPAPQVTPAVDTQVVVTDPSTPTRNPDPQGSTQYAHLTSPTPAPLDDDLQATVAPNAGKNTSATPLHVGKASVLWVEGLTYLPDVSNVTSSPAPAPSATPAPAVLTPSATP